MKSLGMALAVGLILGPLGVMSIGYAAVGVALALSISALSGGVAHAAGLAPTREEAERAKNWH